MIERVETSNQPFSWQTHYHDPSVWFPQIASGHFRAPQPQRGSNEQCEALADPLPSGESGVCWELVPENPPENSNPGGVHQWGYAQNASLFG